jgi:enoyl-CoA hydratase
VTVHEVEREYLSYVGYEALRFERTGDVLVVTIDNPRNAINAVDGALHRELGRAFAELKHERSARAILLTGSGSAFSAGGDFDWMKSITSTGLSQLRTEGKQIVWNALEIEIPVVAAINGPAVGLGATLALLCDVVVMAETATIADPHVRVGLVAGDGGAVLWPMLVGLMQAKRYLLTGDALSATEAERLGLITECVADGDLNARAMRYAEKLASGAPLAVRYTKLAVNQLVKQAMTTAFDYSTSLELLTFVSDDHREALDAIRSKRAPRFEGR